MVVADDGPERDADPEVLEPLGQEKGIGVPEERGKQLRPDGDDLRSRTGGFHLRITRMSLRTAADASPAPMSSAMMPQPRGNPSSFLMG